MAPITQASDESNHQALMDKLDIYTVTRPFRNPGWKPAGRRNKNVRQIISEASRKEVSSMPTEDNSGASTPMPGTNGATGDTTPAHLSANRPDMAKASRDLSIYVREKNAQNGLAQNGTTQHVMTGNTPAVTYTNIESAPSLHPSSQRHYCDITGLPAPYTDPKSRLRYHNGEIFGVVRSLGQGGPEGYLSARNAQIILK